MKEISSGKQVEKVTGDTDQLRLIEGKIWAIFDLLRREIISSDNYDVVLFLLSAFKDGLISKVSKPGVTHLHQLGLDFSGVDPKIADEYRQISLTFEPLVASLSTRSKARISEILFDVDRQALEDKYLLSSD